MVTDATRMVSLIKCLVPKFKVSNEAFKKITSWFLSLVDKLPITVSISITQWIIGNITPYYDIDYIQNDVLIVSVFRFMGPSLSR